jgi:hypothetical protein
MTLFHVIQNAAHRRVHNMGIKGVIAQTLSFAIVNYRAHRIITPRGCSRGRKFAWQKAPRKAAVAAVVTGNWSPAGRNMKSLRKRFGLFFRLFHLVVWYRGNLLIIKFFHKRNGTRAPGIALLFATTP